MRSEVHLLMGAYVLNALNDVERAGFERHLRGCDSCRVEILELFEAVAMLAQCVAVPPPHRLRARLGQEVTRMRQVLPRQRRQRTSGRFRGYGRNYRLCWVGWKRAANSAECSRGP